ILLFACCHLAAARIWIRIFARPREGIRPQRSRRRPRQYAPCASSTLVPTSRTSTLRTASGNGGSCRVKSKPQRGQKCGSPSIQPVISGFSRVINGEEAVPGSWPWQVSLQYEDGFHFCGGSIIDPYWVITAAHCDFKPANHRIIVGEHDKSSNVENIQILYVEKAITHPLYDANTINNDILLLKLKEPAFFGDTVSPICLPRATDTFSPGTHAAVTGWGVTRWNANYGSSTLQQTVLPLISTEDCKKWWGSYIMDPMICAGANGHSTCMGDSGGPLTVQKDGMWVLAGLTSWGNSRCDTSVPVVYTRVTTFVDWIAETMAKN
uniref:Chymotrypsin B-like n=1 Tax=Petromyzon marinus TaxID=7757 RepID=A0AAJ7T1S9_PETMA